MRGRKTPAQQAASDRAHDRRVQTVYGLSEGEYGRLLFEQGGVCAICAKRPRKIRLAVDHDHETGVVIGLLCSRCNRAKGIFEWSDEVLARAIKYFERTLAMRQAARRAAA